MVSAWTLPLIRMELEMLPRGCDFLLDNDDVARLFGAEEEDAGRIATFAASHGCAAKPGQGRVAFRRLAEEAGATATGNARVVECFPPCGPTPHPNSDDHPGPDCH